MKKSRLFLVLTLGILASSCGRSTLELGLQYVPVDANSVVVYYPYRPQCNFETLGLVRIDGGYYSLNSMFRHMRQQAAAIGASAIYVLQTQTLDIKEYTGVAKAIRCLPT